MAHVTESMLIHLAGKVGALLLAQKQTIAVAESCTGGYAAQILTALPGASAWFDRGFVTYSNAAKQEILHVPEHILSVYGAVSLETAQAMASGALAQSHADKAFAITGIAGPDGGTPEKPVGMVCFAWAKCDGENVSEVAYFSGNRRSIRRQAVAFALQGCL
ncbi:MAG: CinA family protein [Zoogloeaceae bacterium]|jgi:nicotinamide-nucleotide amidase|nr:CinA family protein [Zoogloeaceae bacterium]